METNGHQSRERIRARLDHPIVDADGHAVRLWGAGNPAFFEGTAVAKAAAAVLAEAAPAPGRAGG